MLANQVTLSFDDILSAVKESSRGRWFLGEYEQRLRGSESENILSAISKIEGAIARLAPAQGDALLLAKAKSAIATARHDIARLAGTTENVTPEARLFAKLAEQARNSFAANMADGPKTVSVGVERALRLVDELDHVMMADTSALQQAGPNAYFNADKSMFEPLPKPVVVQPVVVQPAAVADVPKVEKAPVETAEAKSPEAERGARLTIRRHASLETPLPVADQVVETASVELAPSQPEVALATPVAAAPAPAIEPPAAPVAVAPAPASTPEAAPAAAIPAAKTSRVVIIRRKPEELMPPPMEDKMEDTMESVASGSTAA